MDECWVSLDERNHQAAGEALYKYALAMDSAADDAADELLTRGGELWLYISEDGDSQSGSGVRYCDAWRDGRIRDGLTCEEIIEACIWAPPGASLCHAMYVLRDKLRTLAHTRYVPEVTRIQQRMVSERAAEESTS